MEKIKNTLYILSVLIFVLFLMGIFNTYLFSNLDQKISTIQSQIVLISENQTKENNINKANEKIREAPKVNVPKPSIPEPIVVSASEDDDASMGSSDAPITIIEFSDYECPFCEKFFSGTLPKLKEKYIDTGKVKFIYRDFPLSFHPNAQKAAEAAECAEEQGKFWEMHDKIFENQYNMTVVDMKQHANDLGLDTSKFDLCLDSGKYSDEVQKDFADESSYGVQRTPTFYINGEMLVGALPFEAFEQIIESKLAGEN